MSEQRRHAAQGLVGLGGPIGRVGRPPRVRVVLVIRGDLRAGRQPGEADEQDHALWDERLITEGLHVLKAAR